MRKVPNSYPSNPKPQDTTRETRCTLCCEQELLWLVEVIFVMLSVSFTIAVGVFCRRGSQESAPRDGMRQTWRAFELFTRA